MPWDLVLASPSNLGPSGAYILLTFITPLIGAYSLHVTKLYFEQESRLLSHFNIPLFLLGAFLKPFLYYMRLARKPCRVVNSEATELRLAKIEEALQLMEIHKGAEKTDCNEALELFIIERFNEIDKRLAALERNVKKQRRTHPNWSLGTLVTVPFSLCFSLPSYMLKRLAGSA